MNTPTDSRKDGGAAAQQAMCDTAIHERNALRDEFAGKAMAAMLSTSGYFARQGYAYARQLSAAARQYESESAYDEAEEEREEWIDAHADLIVTVEVWADGRLFRKYTMNHDDQAQRRVLGEQCRNAFEGGQRIVTYPTGATHNR